jgi:hypothetical protein
VRSMRLGKPVRDVLGSLRAPAPQADDTGADSSHSPGPVRSGPKVAGLLALLGGITTAGVLIGHAIEPARVHVTSTTTTTATTTVAAKKPVPPPKWGPLAAARFGRLPAGKEVAAAVLAGRRLVVIEGTTRAVLAGPAGGALARVSALPARLSAAAAFADAGDVLVVGGEHGTTPTDEILRITLASRKVIPAGRFTEPLAEAGVVSRNGSVYLVGGWTGEKYATAVLRFVPPRQVTVVARLPDGVRSPAVALVGNRLYVAGGRTRSGRTRKVYAVDTQSGAVKALGELPQAVDRAALVAAGGKLYLLGGRSAGGQPVAAIVRIDPRTGRVTHAGRMPAPLAGVTAIPFGGRTLIVGAPSGLVYRIG